ncbi:hypothetical protein PoB_002417400 [Plakobranchus ocellatus]|uniref:Uncharacterized protein n=1 Tax=Plakobranchus ocellatus TaxID=259542 RepID=A0AAV3ZTD7_9GAST|nr:hypothetical protein PoB_002417400 [Plakobranchus ocellatus]
MSNSQHRKGSLERLPNVHTRGPTLNTGLQFGKTSDSAHERSNSQHGAIRQDFRMYTQEVQLSTRDRNLKRLPNVHARVPTLNTGLEYGKTSEYSHKRCNAPHGKGNLARHPNMHTRGVTLNTV